MTGSDSHPVTHRIKSEPTKSKVEDNNESKERVDKAKADSKDLEEKAASFHQQEEHEQDLTPETANRKV